MPEIRLRPYANPLPLGFFCFGVGMAMLSGLDSGLLAGDQSRAAGILIAAFVFPLELLAAILAFLARDTGAAGALGLFATSWLALGLLHVVAPQERTSAAAGLYLAAFAVMLVPLAVAAMFGKRLLGVVLSVSALRAALAAAFQLRAPSAFGTADAVVALLLFVLALYAGTAFLFEDLRQHTVLPIFRRGGADRAINADLDAQYARLPREPGVRQQL